FYVEYKTPNLFVSSPAASKVGYFHKYVSSSAELEYALEYGLDESKKLSEDIALLRKYQGNWQVKFPKEEDFKDIEGQWFTDKTFGEVVGRLKALPPNKDVIFRSVDEAVKTPVYLYHGTFKPLLQKIQAEGLKVTGTEKNYSDSEEGFIYLAETPEEAEAFAEVSETVPDEWVDQIVVLKIDTSKIDAWKIADDPNVQDTEIMTYVYPQDIPAAAITLVESIDETKAGMTTNHKTRRMDVVIETYGERLFLTGRLEKNQRTWIDVSNTPVAEGTLDVDSKNGIVYLNRMDALRSGKGYGRELLEYGIHYAMEKYGVTKARGYIESANATSQSMLRKMGFNSTEQTKDGSYWEKSLNEPVDETVSDESGFVGIKEAGWIHPDGTFEEIPNYSAGDHDRDAFEKLHPGESPKSKWAEENNAYREYVKAGHIRCIPSKAGFNIELEKKPTESQMRTIRRMLEEGTGEFFFSTRSSATGNYSHDGHSWEEFIKIYHTLP
ncbi:MAG: GNAT family N-acetyltransferase, partial [Thermoplasmata archaeon]|nr:GNAT family N-acetyltransferase [Thermoplasmata archaeon]